MYKTDEIMTSRSTSPGGHLPPLRGLPDYSGTVPVAFEELKAKVLHTKGLCKDLIIFPADQGQTQTCCRKILEVNLSLLNN